MQSGDSMAIILGKWSSRRRDVSWTRCEAHKFSAKTFHSPDTITCLQEITKQEASCARLALSKLADSSKK